MPHHGKGNLDNPPYIPCDTYDDWAGRIHNAASFVDVPRSQLPWEVVRIALKIRALSGYDCYAYRPTHSEHWVIWDRQDDPAAEARFTPREWAILHGYAVPEIDEIETTGQEGA